MDTKKLIEEVLRIGTQVRVSEPKKKGLPKESPFYHFVTRMGLEPMTPTLKVLCSTN